MTEYVVGFLFDRSMQRVALIKKTRPEWQRGHLNGVGGKVEARETPHDAMVREFTEEAGLLVPKWKLICVLGGPEVYLAKSHRPDPQFQIHFFYALDDRITAVKSMTDEELVIERSDLNYTCDRLPNLRWLIPMAQSIEEGEDVASSFIIKEVHDRPASAKTVASPPIQG